MWLMLNTGFLSIVQPSDRDLAQFAPAGDDLLLVRARARGHIEAAFPAAEVLEVKGRDYLFRAFVPRAQVAAKAAELVTAIDYGNFKDSVPDRALHDAYADCWSVFYRYQRAEAHKPHSGVLRARRGGY